MCKLFHPFSDGCNYIKKKKKRQVTDTFTHWHLFLLLILLQHLNILSFLSAFSTMNIVSVAMSIKDCAGKNKQTNKPATQF